MLVLDRGQLLSELLYSLRIFFIILGLCFLDVVELLFEDLAVGLQLALLHQYFLVLAFETLLLATGIILGLAHLLLVLFLKLQLDILLSPQLVLHVAALDIQDFCYELGFAL